MKPRDKKKRRKAHAPKEPQEPSRYRAVLREALIVPDHPNNRTPVILAAGAVVQLMDMRVMFRDRISPVTRRADEVLVRWGPKGKERLGWLSKDTPLKEVRGPLFMVRTADRVKLSPWDRIRYFIGRADARQTHGKRWWLLPWLLANGAEFDVEVLKAIREFGGRADKKQTDTDVHVAHLYRLITGQEIDMKTEREAVKGSKKSSKKGSKVTKEVKVAKKAKGNGKAEKPAKLGKLPAFVSSKNHAKYQREREFDVFTIKRLTKDNPHRPGSTQAKRWSILKKGMSIAEYVAKGGSRGTLSQWLKGGAAKIVRAGGGAESSAE